MTPMHAIEDTDSDHAGPGAQGSRPPDNARRIRADLTDLHPLPIT